MPITKKPVIARYSGRSRMGIPQSQINGAIMSMQHPSRFQETPDLPRICIAPARAMYVGPKIGINEAFAAFGIRASLPMDERIAKVVLAIEKRPDAFGRMQEAAALACLSLSRFRARFDAEVGLPFRQYRLWLRGFPAQLT